MAVQPRRELIPYIAPDLGPIPTSLVEGWFQRVRTYWIPIVLAVGLAMVLLSVGTAALDGHLEQPLDGDFWRLRFLPPAMIMLLAFAYPFLDNLRREAVRAFQPLLGLDDAHFNALLIEATPYHPRGELIAMGAGAWIGLLLLRPWAWTYLGFLPPYELLISLVMYAFLAWGVWTVLNALRLIDRLQRQDLVIDIFNLPNLQAVGRFSLGIALVYVGAVTLALFCNGFDRGLLERGEAVLVVIVVYSIAVATFFITQNGTHRLLLTAKEREMRYTRRKLAEAYRALHESATAGLTEEYDANVQAVATWLSVERRLNGITEWPFPSEALWTLLGSIGVSLLILLARPLFELIRW